MTLNYLIGSFDRRVEDSPSTSIEKFFILLGSTKIYFYEANDYGVYETRETSITEADADVDLITSGCFFFMNKDLPMLKAYARKIFCFYFKIFWRKKLLAIVHLDGS